MYQSVKRVQETFEFTNHLEAKHIEETFKFLNRLGNLKSSQLIPDK